MNEPITDRVGSNDGLALSPVDWGVGTESRLKIGHGDSWTQIDWMGKSCCVGLSNDLATMPRDDCSKCEWPSQ